MGPFQFEIKGGSLQSELGDVKPSSLNEDENLIDSEDKRSMRQTHLTEVVPTRESLVELPTDSSGSSSSTPKRRVSSGAQPAVSNDNASSLSSGSSSHQEPPIEHVKRDDVQGPRKASTTHSDIPSTADGNAARTLFKLTHFDTDMDKDKPSAVDKILIDGDPQVGPSTSKTTSSSGRHTMPVMSALQTMTSTSSGRLPGFAAEPFCVVLPFNIIQGDQFPRLERAISQVLAT